MFEVTLAQSIAALKAVGVQPADGLLVHSAVQFLGVPQGGVGLYYRALCAVLDSVTEPSQVQPPLASGTLAVPAFSFAYARGLPYDPETTPSERMGAFSEYVRQLPEARRTPHPMQSLALVGRYAGDLADRDTLSAFDPGSAFERMLELDFKLLLLGADVQSVSMLHYSEQRAGVPYRYWKDFSGPVKTQADDSTAAEKKSAQGWQTRTYRMFVRDLDLDPRIELFPVQRTLESRGLWRVTPLNYGQLSLCQLADFVSVLDEYLARDPWSLVTNRPSP